MRLAELCGPSSGGGLAELAAYNAHGNGSLTTLSEGQVGAIYLGHADTPFSLMNPQNALQGQIAASGIYLSEAGGIGSVQQVDLAV